MRPRTITIISWFFIIFGSIALLSGVLPFRDLMSHWYVHLSRLLMIIAGVFMLKGHNWARWLLVVWITFHIIISALHSALFLLMHVVIFSAILYFVFRREASTYFVAASTR